ncbi:MAG: CAP domain-containing protein [Bacteroidota bacterium]|nr:CAP domain-containing protein [Candidatus Kapabacteria bacterium]MDW8220321.1 CAP domain-containing protein [Bacteroidota bacterium]
MKALTCSIIAVFVLGHILVHAQQKAAPAHKRTAKSVALPFSQAERDSILAFHNAVRREVGAPPVVWSQELADFAQAWAEHLARTGCRLAHRPSSGPWAQKYGENCFGGSGGTWSLLDAGKSWYEEKALWNGGVITAQNWSVAGHYTQMVWSRTRRIGLGKARCPNGGTIIVANYDPPGNMIGESPY